MKDMKLSLLRLLNIKQNEIVLHPDVQEDNMKLNSCNGTSQT